MRVPQMVQLLSRTHSLGLYVQDKWQLRQNLTLSVGLRYDVHNSPVNESWNPYFASADDYPIDKNNFQPRVGFAYSTGPGAVLRGGYGLFYEKQWIDRFENYPLNPVFTNSFIAQYPVSQVDPGPAAGRFPTDPLLVNGPTLNRALINQLVPPGTLARNTAAVWLDTPNRILPYQHQASIGYERQLGRQLAFAADYVHMINKDLPLRYNQNPGIKANTGRTSPIARVDLDGLAGQLGLSPFSSDVWIVEYLGETTYDGLNLQFEKRYSNNWGARFSYGLGHGRGNTNGTPTATNDFQVLGDRNLELNEGPTNLDRRHTATISGRFELPWVKGADRRRGRADDDRAAVHHPQQQHRREPQRRADRSASRRNLQRRRPERDHGRERRRAQRRLRAGLAPDRSARRLPDAAGRRALDRLLLRGVQHHQRAELRQPDRRPAVGKLPGGEHARRRRLPASVPDRRAVRVLRLRT